MGNQQLLLLVLSFLLVALSIFVGYNLAIEYQQESNRDELLKVINQLYYEASVFRKKVGELGGGNGSYANWKIENKFKNIKNVENIDIDYTFYKDKIVFKALGDVTGWDGKNKTKVWVRFSDQNGKTIRILN